MLAYTMFALFTLFSSVVWHTMAGCAHHRGMVLCAKVDYVGIAWYVGVRFYLVVLLNQHNYVSG